MRSLFFLFTILCLISCDTESTQQVADVETAPKVNVAPKEDEKKEEFRKFVNQDLLGTYVGMFEAKEYDDDKKPMWSNKINVSIDNVEGNKIEGHSVVAGNDRPFSGTYEVEEGHIVKVAVSEPGDDRYDGVFKFRMYPHSESIIGYWESNDKNLSVTKRIYELEKTSFKYNPELQPEWSFDEMYDTWDEDRGEGELLKGDFLKFNASTQALKKEDIENMYMADLEVIRNSIYARHGYSFKNRRMRYIFNFADWYIPYSTDIRDQLTDLEKKNIELIKRYEEHAEKYYDYFGR